MRHLVFRLNLLGLAVILALAGSNTRAAPDLRVINFAGSRLFYQPDAVIITVGSAVRWAGDFVEHPLASADGLWPIVASGGEFMFTFVAPGTYQFYCTLHGVPGRFMAGEVIVRELPTPRVYLPLARR